MANKNETTAPVLAWLRKLIKTRGSNTADLAKRSGLDKARLRRVLTGTEDMMLEELLKLSNALEISPTDMGLPDGLAQSVAPDEDAPTAAEQAEVPVADPWGNHTEQLFRIGFALGCDFVFVTAIDQLGQSGVPANVVARYGTQPMPITLDAAYHRYNEPKYSGDGIELVLSFDGLYTCRFPWASIRQVLFLPAAPAPPESLSEEKPKGPPKLRLVT